MYRLADLPKGTFSAMSPMINLAMVPNFHLSNGQTPQEVNFLVKTSGLDAYPLSWLLRYVESHFNDVFSTK
jgi:hypothetical protein